MCADKSKMPVRQVQLSAAPAVRSQLSEPDRFETAQYVADMLSELEDMAGRAGLSVVSMMIAMAREQALDESIVSRARVEAEQLTA